MKIGLFIPCYVDAVYPEVGMASWKLLKHLGVDVTYPEKQTCSFQRAWGVVVLQVTAASPSLN